MEYEYGAPDDLLFDEDDESKHRFYKLAKKRKVNEKLKPELPNYFIYTFVAKNIVNCLKDKGQIPCLTTSSSKRSWMRLF